MRTFALHISVALALASAPTRAQQHDLVGYWHNWNDGSAPYMALSEIDDRYTVIDIAFAEPVSGTSHLMAFSPSGTPQSTFIAEVAALRAQGKKVLISIGGANASVHLDSDQERDEFVSSMLAIVGTYGFDGIDIDLEGSSVAITGGTIVTPNDAAILRLIDAINAVADAYEASTGVPMMLTMAPETAYVQGGQSAFGGIWGAYLPVIDALRDRIDILHVQLYNSGSMYGIDGGIYAQGSADFIVSQTEAVLQGFSTGGGFFAPLPAEKVAVGLPACPSAAGGGYVSPAVLAAAVGYLRGAGPQPGQYQLISTYPDLRGLMTWSINWDAAPGCAAAYEFADSYEEIFDLSTTLTEVVAPIRAATIQDGDLFIPDLAGQSTLSFFDSMGRHCADALVQNGRAKLPSNLRQGIYSIVLADSRLAPMRVLVP